MTVDLGSLRILAEGLDHPEGVCAGPRGELYAGGEGGQLYLVDPEGDSFREVANTGGFLLGLCCDGAGQVYACDLRRREVLRVDPRSGRVEVWSRGTEERPMVTPNVPVFDAAGNLYVTDSGTWKGDDGCVFRVDPRGRAQVWTRACSNFPNGACLTADGSALLVLESLTPALVRVPVLPDGRAGPREVVAVLPGTVPDGVVLDAEGNAYVCCYRPDRILRVSPAGRVELVADDPQGTVLAAPTNAAWAGEDLGTLVVANLGRWHLTALRPGVRGLPPHYPPP